MKAPPRDPRPNWTREVDDVSSTSTSAFAEVKPDPFAGSSSSTTVDITKAEIGSPNFGGPKGETIGPRANHIRRVPEGVTVS